METTSSASESPDKTDTTPPQIFDKNDDPSLKTFEQSLSTPLPSKKKYDIMKDPAFLTSTVNPRIISPKESLSTQKPPLFSHTTPFA